MAATQARQSCVTTGALDLSDYSCLYKGEFTSIPGPQHSTEDHTSQGRDLFADTRLRYPDLAVRTLAIHHLYVI